jgi:hypothetical protein
MQFRKQKFRRVIRLRGDFAAAGEHRIPGFAVGCSAVFLQHVDDGCHCGHFCEKLVLGANRYAVFPFRAGLSRVQVLCLRVSPIFRANGLERHKVQNQVLLGK